MKKLEVRLDECERKALFKEILNGAKRIYPEEL